MLPDAVSRDAEGVIAAYREAGLKIVTAESCTGGLIAACLTQVPGASEVLERGFVPYSNQAKIEQLGVSADVLRDFGAVSAEAARAMATGALDHSPADVAVSVTGIAGPGGATAEKPVGLVYLGAARRGAAVLDRRQLFVGDRGAVRLAAATAALALLQSLLGP